MGVQFSTGKMPKMDEILFRAKAIGETGEWVEGFYLAKTDPLLGIKKHFILCQDITPNGVLNSMFSWYVVDPDTVSRYTGYTDNEGVKLFGGHIVKRAKNGSVAYITFEKGQWMLKKHLEDGYCEDHLWTWASEYSRGGCTQIGNIYDDSHLLTRA